MKREAAEFAWELMPAIRLSHRRYGHRKAVARYRALNWANSPLWDDMPGICQDIMQLWIGRHEDEEKPCCFMIAEIRCFLSAEYASLT
jgi:hypothetical protein